MAVEINAAPLATQYTGRGPAQHTEMVRLVHVQTGDVIERLPVDAREILASGEYVVEGTPVPEKAPDAGPKPATLPKIAQLAEAIASLDKEAVEAMQATDDRPTAAPIYAARLAALAAEPPGA